MNQSNRTARWLFPLLALCVAVLSQADQTVLGESALHQALLDLGTDMRLMCLAAHPDDEDGATLALYRKAYGCKTFAVIATRGEGGQNEIGPELYEDLGVIRTREMMRAAAITGAELRFLNLAEFGYSKSADEAFAVWGKEETLRRLVEVIREVRPDVIITHHGRAKDHGHHQAIGQALIEAFDLAASPSTFPEQIDRGLAPWQASRLFIRVPKPGGAVKCNVGALEPWSGETYAEIAARALGEHRSQGMGFFIDRLLTGTQVIHYELVKEAAPPETGSEYIPARGPLFAGLPDRVSPEDRALSDAACSRWVPDSAAAMPLEQVREALVARLRGRTVDAGTLLADDAELRGLARADRALAALCQFRVTATVDDPVVVPGQTVTITMRLTDFGSTDSMSADFCVVPSPWLDADSPGPGEMRSEPDEWIEFDWEYVVPEDAQPTVPHAEHLSDEHFLEPALSARASPRVGDPEDPVIVRLEAPVTIDVAPAVEIEMVGAPYLVRRGIDSTVRLVVALTNRAPHATTGDLVLSASPGLTIETRRVPFSIEDEDATQIASVGVQVSETVALRDYTLTAMIAGASTETGSTAPTVRHATVRVVDLALPEAPHIGVIQSYDDTFVTSLDRLGIPHEAFTLEDFAPDQLNRFTAIIVDIRAYLVRPDLVANNQVLLEYVHRGGTLLVMYQKTFEWDPAYAPYPIRLSRNRVTREDAPIEILAPEHPLFNAPNRIEPGDWNGWRQERGLYFPDQWDERYTPLVRCADPGEDPPPGSCLVAQYGDGVYLYTALGWYRQLRELHPGALRLFANMLALKGVAEAPDVPEAQAAEPAATP